MKNNKEIEKRERLIIENFHRVAKQLGILNEHGNYDLVSQFNGIHDGNKMEKNGFLHTLGLNETGISTLNDLLNLISSDEHFMGIAYPNGCSYVDIILDITNFFDNNQRAMDLIATRNPIEYANKLKSAIAKKRTGNLYEELAVASDGGYYDKPEYKIEMDYQDIKKLKQAGEKVFNALSGIDGNDGNFSPDNEWEEKILKGLITNGIKLEYDSEEGTNYYWLNNEESIETLKDEIEAIIDNTYDKSTYTSFDDYYEDVLINLEKLDSGDKLINRVKSGRYNDMIKSNFERKFPANHTAGHIRGHWYGV